MYFKCEPFNIKSSGVRTFNSDDISQRKKQAAVILGEFALVACQNFHGTSQERAKKAERRTKTTNKS